METPATSVWTPASLKSRSSATVPRSTAIRLTVAILILRIFPLISVRAFAQGETTSAIVGQVSDASGAAVPGATATVHNTDTGLQRIDTTDDSGRFDFPQLKPGTYTVRVEGQGFEPQQNDAVTSGLGQKQTVDFILKIAQANESMEVSGEAVILNPENANTSTTFSAPALENLPNPGGDLTYPLQSAAWALINTAGNGNDFVGGTNGYGNVEFNGLPALSNGYIDDGLETNDPLTNLNSGLSTNLVLGLNSISEVTVNTLSYAVDQGRYGASQVNYVTKSGSNRFHGNLYELWNGSKLDAADYFTNATPGNHKPGSTVNHFGGSIGGPIVHDKLFFFLDSEWVRIALPIVTPATAPTSGFQTYVLQHVPLSEAPFYAYMFSVYGNSDGTPQAVLGCPLGLGRATDDGNACANRQSVSHYELFCSQEGELIRASETGLCQETESGGVQRFEVRNEDGELQFSQNAPAGDPFRYVGIFSVANAGREIFYVDISHDDIHATGTNSVHVIYYFDPTPSGLVAFDPPLVGVDGFAHLSTGTALSRTFNTGFFQFSILLDFNLLTHRIEIMPDQIAYSAFPPVGRQKSGPSATSGEIRLYSSHESAAPKADVRIVPGHVLKWWQSLDPVEKPAAGQVITILAAWAPARLKPADNAPDGVKMVYYDWNNLWLQIQVDDRTGWVKGTSSLHTIGLEMTNAQR
jgi:hypothetical protein